MLHRTNINNIFLVFIFLLNAWNVHVTPIFLFMVINYQETLKLNYIVLMMITVIIAKNPHQIFEISHPKCQTNNIESWDILSKVSNGWHWIRRRDILNEHLTIVQKCDIDISLIESLLIHRIFLHFSYIIEMSITNILITRESQDAPLNHFIWGHSKTYKRVSHLIKLLPINIWQSGIRGERWQMTEKSYRTTCTSAIEAW